MKNALYFMLKALFVLKIFTIFSWLFDHVGKRFDKKANVDFKIYDVTDCVTNSYNTHIAQISRSKDNQATEFGQLIKNNRSNFHPQKS